MKMKANIYIPGLAALLLCAACSKEDLAQPITNSQSEEIQFGATLQTLSTIEARNLGDGKAETVALPYINGIYVRKIGDTVTNSQYHVRNGNKGTLDVSTADEEASNSTTTALKWTPDEKSNNTTIHFYSWTTPKGVTITATNTDADNTNKGTIDFGEDEGNHAPETSSGSPDPANTLNDEQVTPLEVFISAHTTGSYKDNPTISLPFTHPVCKVSLVIYDQNNKRISDSDSDSDTGLTIEFPFIKQKWNMEQVQTESSEEPFAVTDPVTDDNSALKFTIKNLWKPNGSNYRIFYLPPMTGDYSFDNAGDFIITYNSKEYYGTLNDLNLNVFDSNSKELKAGQHMVCRIDLNENYGTGVGAWIAEWKFEDDIAYADPYRGIYTLRGLEALRDYITSTETSKTLPDSLYIEETSGTKIIRLYNDLTLPSDWSSLSLTGFTSDNIVFDGLGHTITTNTTSTDTNQSLFGEVKAESSKTISLQNIRIAGAGQLASSVEDVNTIFNCHAGTGNLVGIAKGTTTFNFCSAEGGGTLINEIASGANITIQNSFVASSATGFVSTTTGTVTSKNSFIINSTGGTYYSDTSTNTNGETFTIATNITDTTVGTENLAKLLIDLLNTASQTDTDTEDHWVYVYGKSYPVMRIK